MSQDLNIPQGNFLGHPKGLYLLFVTEMWERFSYYGMRALLVLYAAAATHAANPGLGWAEPQALKLYAWYTGFIYLTPIFGGWVADRVSRRHVIGLSLLVWSAVTWWTGQVTTFGELMTARALMGVSEAFYIPAALALIADYHPGLTRSRAIGMHQTGIYVGQILGGFAGYAADSPDHGWRWVFTTCGMMGVIYAMPLLAMLRNPARPVADAATRL